MITVIMNENMGRVDQRAKFLALAEDEVQSQLTEPNIGPNGGEGIAFCARMYVLMKGGWTTLEVASFFDPKTAFNASFPTFAPFFPISHTPESHNQQTEDKKIINSL